MRALRLATFSLCAVVCVAAAAVADGNTGLVYVHVTDAKTGKPMQGWTVQVTAVDGDTQAVTGATGQANFLSVMPGMARIDVLRQGELGACPAVITVSANERTIVNVHLRRTRQPQLGCSPRRAQTLLRPGVTSDVYDIY